MTKTTMLGVCKPSVWPRAVGGEGGSEEMGLEKREGDLEGSYEMRIGRVMRAVVGL